MKDQGFNGVRRLWSDSGPESEKAEKLLKSRHVKVITVKFRPSKKGDEGPVLVTPRGVFKGIGRIEEYCNYWTKMEAVAEQVAQQ